MQGYLTSTRFISLKVSISVAKNSYYFINQNKKKNKKKIKNHTNPPNLVRQSFFK